MCTPRASASTSSGWACSRSIRSRTRRSSARSRSCSCVAGPRAGLLGTSEIVPLRAALAQGEAASGRQVLGQELEGRGPGPPGGLGVVHDEVVVVEGVVGTVVQLDP